MRVGINLGTRVLDAALWVLAAYIPNKSDWASLMAKQKRPDHRVGTFLCAAKGVWIATLNRASVLVRISSSPTPGAVSMRRMVSPGLPCRSIAKTPRLVITRSTQVTPVSGKLHWRSNLGSPAFEA